MTWPILHHSNLKQRVEEAMRKYDERRYRESRKSQKAVITSTSLFGDHVHVFSGVLAPVPCRDLAGLSSTSRQTCGHVAAQCLGNWSAARQLNLAADNEKEGRL